MDPTGGVLTGRWTYLALVAVMIGAMAIRLIPLIDFTLWGSDWGEYYSLTQELVDSGNHVDTNPGWGKAYVDFPGLFDLAGGFALVTGISVTTTITLAIPCVTAISCLLVACIVLRLGGGPWAALFAACLLAVIFPEVYTNSHPVPGPLGSVLVMAIMLIFIIGDRWRREENVDANRPLVLYLIFILLIAALTVTHHLSLFFVIFVLGAAYLIRMALVHGTEDARSTWGLATFAIAMVSATVYWLIIATTFRDAVMLDLFGLPGQLVIAAAWIGVIVIVLLGLWLRGRRTSVPETMFWGPGLLRVTVLVFMACGVVILGLVAVFGVPGTDIQPGSGMALYTIPVLVAFAMGVGAADVLIRRHSGHVIVGWVITLVASFMFSVAIRSEVLVPYRHLPYIVEVSVVFLGIGIVHLRRMTLPEGRAFSRMTGVAASMLIVVLVVTAYPPKEVMAGFQEGTNQHEVEAAIWLRNGLPRPGAIVDDDTSGAVATDHRLSSMSFGIGDKMATWDKGGAIMYGVGDASTLEALRSTETPYGNRPVTAVLLSEDLRTGAALSQYESAEPVEGEAWDKFFGPPFVRLYDGGDVWVFGVPQPATSW